MVRSVIFPTLLSFCMISPALAQEEEEKTIMLDSVVVWDKALKEGYHNVANYVDKLEIRQANPRDVGEYLRSIPNVSGIRKGGSAIDPVVRGFKYSQLNVILDNGLKIENGCPNRMDPVSAHIEAEDIEKMEVIKGPFSLRYGPSFGGVINLISQNPFPTEQFELHSNLLYGAESNWNGNKLHGSVYGGNNKIFFLLSGGYRNYGNYTSGGWEGNDTTYSSSLKKYNYKAKVGFSIKSNHQIIVSYDGVHGRDVMYPALPMDEKNDDTDMVSIDYSARNIRPNLKSLDLKIYRSAVDHVMDNSHRSNYETMLMVADVNAINTGGNAALTMQFGQAQVVAGLDLENIEKDGMRTGTMSMMGTTSTKVTNLWKDALITNVGIFAEYKRLFNAYEVDAAIRGDFNHATSEDTLKIIKNDIEYFNDVQSQYFNLSASIGITRMINQWCSISLALGSGTRSPNMLERYIKLLPVGYDQYDYLGNPQLKPETNNEADLTLRYNQENTGSVYLNFFYSYVQNYITANLLPSSVIKPQSPGVLGVKQFDNADYVIHRGFEFGYRTPEIYKIGGNIVAAYTYGVIPTVTKYIISGNQVTDAIEIKNDALPEIPPFETTLNVYYKMLNGNLMPKLALRAAAAQRHTSQAFYETDTPGFWILNFSTAIKISKHTELNAGINNIFDKAYYEHLNRRIIGTTINLYEPGRVFFASLFVNL